MKIVPHSFMKKKYKFHNNTLVESVEELPNPARGWYRIYTFCAEEKFNSEDYKKIEDNKDMLALVFIDIGAYREKKLDEEVLLNIDAILKFFTERKKDIILRIAYDHKGMAPEREPFFFSYVTDHITQLSGLLIKYARCIYVYQGMLIGNWGEMHTSRFLTNLKMRKLAALLYKCVGNESFLAVRKPSQWRIINYEEGKREDFKNSRIGLFDDAVFGSATHLGTFSESKKSGAWTESWFIEKELDFERRLCRYVPNGGEVLYDEEDAKKRSLTETVDRLRLMNISYLNRAYDRKQLDMWKNMFWESSDVWSGVNAYDYIGRHLGYRFCIRDVSMKYIKGKNPVCTWKIAIENVGFARCYHEAAVWLLCISEDEEVHSSRLSVNLDMILPGETMTGVCNLVPKPGDVYLYAERKKDKTPICFANVAKQQQRIFLGKLSLQ